MEHFHQIGERIKAKRISKGWTQQDLATATGHHLQSIFRWEKGERSPVGESLVRLANALGTSAEWLFSGEPTVPVTPREIQEAIARERMADYSSASPNIELLASAIEFAEGLLTLYKRTLPAEEKAQLVLEIYNYCMSRGVLDVRTVPPDDLSNVYKSRIS